MEFTNKIKNMEAKEALWKGFVWFVVIAMIVSPIAVYLV